MLDRLITLFLGFIEAFKFCCIIKAYEQAVVLRWGRFSRVLRPGFHWIWPFFIELLLVDNVVLATRSLVTQSLMTKDHKQVVVEAVVSYKICDIKKFLLTIEGADQVLIDSTYGVVSQVIQDRTWEELCDARLGDTLTTIVRKAAFQWGVEVLRVRLKDLSLSRSYRLWMVSV